MRSKNLIIFTLAVVFGFLLPDFGIAIKNTLVIQLIILMSFSLKPVNLKKPKKNEKDKIWQNLLASQIALLAIPAAYFLFSNQDYINGIILWAITPPALGIVTLSKMTKLNVKETMLNETVQYAFYLFWMPFMAFILLGKNISIIELVKQIAYLIILPFIISRFLRYYKKPALDRNVIIFSFAAVFYTLVSINSAQIMSNLGEMGIIFAFFLIPKFGLLFFFNKLLDKKYDKTDKVDFILFSTIKSGGFTAALAVLLLNPAATFPITIEMLTYIIYITFIDFYY